MKTKLIKQIATGILIYAMILTTGTSCKKDKNTDPNNPEINLITPPPTMTFGAINFLTDYEKDNNLKHQAYLIGSHFAASDQIESDMYGFKWKDLDPVYDYHQVMNDYSKVSSDIETIKTKISDVVSKIKQIDDEIEHIVNELRDIENQLKIDVKEFEALLQYNSLLAEQMAIDNLFDIEDEYSGFMYFIHRADSIANHYTLDPITRRLKMKELAGEFKHYATSAHDDAVNISITNISGALGNAQGAGTYNLMSTIMDIMLLKTGNKPTPEDALMYYSYIEKIYLHATQHMLKGLILKGNFLTWKENNPTKFFNYKKNTFNPKIKAQNQLLLDVSSRMVMYLTKIKYSQYKDDMVYVDYGLAPDNEFIDILARSSFTASVLQNDGDTLHPIIGGIIYTPYFYNNNGKGPSKDEIISINCQVDGSSGVNSGLTLQCNSQNITKSIIPYTKWTAKDQICTASPDNQWLFYNGNYETSNTGGLPEKTSVTILSPPWINNSDISIELKMMWYNPQNPDSETATTTKQGDNTMQFGFFAARWLWGYQALNQGSFNTNNSYTNRSTKLYNTYYLGTDANVWQKENPAYVKDFLSDFQPDTYLTPGNKNQKMNNYYIMDIENSVTSLNNKDGGLDAQYISIIVFENNPGSITQSPPVTFFCDAFLKRKGSFLTPEGGSFSRSDIAYSYLYNNKEEIVGSLGECKNIGTMSKINDTTNIPNTHATDSLHITNPSFSDADASYSYTVEILHRSHNIDGIASLSDKLNTPFKFVYKQNTQPIFRTTFDIGQSK